MKRDRVFPNTPKNRSKNSKLKFLFGITLREYDAMLASQNDRCRLCNRHKSEFPKNLQVDHNHKTGKIRGLLCGQCNRGIGLLGDSREILLKAADYV